MNGGRVRLTVVRYGEPNRWDERPEVSRHVVDRCALVPGTSTEPGEWSNAVESAVTVLAPYGADVRADDQVEVSGLLDDVDGRPIRWQVVGTPARWRHPTARSGSGTTISLTRTGG